jgi:hypothetical protein
MTDKPKKRIWGRDNTPGCTAIDKNKAILVEETQSSAAILAKSSNSDDLTGISRCADCFLYRTR